LAAYAKKDLKLVLPPWPLPHQICQYGWTSKTSVLEDPQHTQFFFFFFFLVIGELSTLRQLMKVPNEPGLSPNNGLENVSLSDQSTASNPRKGQAKCPGANTQF